MDEPDEIRKICVVMEDRTYLFGVFTDEATARRGYGVIGNTPVEFITCSLFGTPQ